MSKSNEPNLDDLVTIFRDYKGDETGGLHAMRGFSFQVWQAVLEAIRAHATGEDYAVVLEWQQDIAVLDSSIAPSKIKFIQSKKNESAHHWTLAALIAPKDDKKGDAEDDLGVEPEPAPAAAKAKASAVYTPKRRLAIPPKKPKLPKPSILSKLYSHRRRFHASAPTSLIFSSNAPFYVHVDDTTERAVTNVHLDELPRPAKTKVEAALKKQLKIADGEPINLVGFNLEVTNCPLDDAHKFAIGELVEQCTFKNIEPEVVAPFVAVCLVASYVQSRAGKSPFAKDFKDLMERAVTRDDVAKYFAAANDSHVSTQELVEEVIARLNLEGADFDVVRSMKRELNLACSIITNRAGVVWASIEALASLFRTHDSYRSSGAVKNRFEAWLTDFRDLDVSGSATFKDGYIFCFMAMILNDAKPIQHLSAPASDSKPEGEK